MYYRSVKLIMKGATYTEAIYFIYVTISTIGFGDFVIRFEEESEVNRLVSRAQNYSALKFVLIK